MHRLTYGVFLSLIVVACSACSSSSDNTTAATQGSVSSCDLTADSGFCIDFPADAPKDEAVNNCNNSNSTIGSHGVASATTSCVSPNRVGSCLYKTPDGINATYRYSSPKFTAESAKTNCDHLPVNPGVFTPG